MNITMEQAKKILNGNYIYVQFGFAMLITRMKSLYAKDQSQVTLQHCTNEINAFLDKYKTIMQPDFAMISKL